jgi:hypothetical protein
LPHAAPRGNLFILTFLSTSAFPVVLVAWSVVAAMSYRAKRQETTAQPLDAPRASPHFAVSRKVRITKHTAFVGRRVAMQTAPGAWQAALRRPSPEHAPPPFEFDFLEVYWQIEAIVQMADGSIETDIRAPLVVTLR